MTFAVVSVHLRLQLFDHLDFLFQVGLHVGLSLHRALELGLQHVLLVSQLRVHFHEAFQLLLELHGEHMSVKSGTLHVAAMKTKWLTIFARQVVTMSEKTK